jgi:hypothetical protein
MATSQQDFQFVGDAYPAADPRQDCQICVNWYVEISRNEGSKTPTALLGCPGLIQVASAVGL